MVQVSTSVTAPSYSGGSHISATTAKTNDRDGEVELVEVTVTSWFSVQGDHEKKELMISIRAEEWQEFSKRVEELLNPGPERRY